MYGAGVDIAYQDCSPYLQQSDQLRRYQSPLLCYGGILLRTSYHIVLKMKKDT